MILTTPQRFIVDMRIPGSTFVKAVKKRLEAVYPGTPVDDMVRFIYSDSCSQAVFAMSGDALSVAKLLQNLPNKSPYAHIAAFNDPNTWSGHCQEFREFALALMFEIHRMMGIQSNVAYTLETSTPDCLVLHAYPEDWKTK